MRYPGGGRRSWANKLFHDLNWGAFIHATRVPQLRSCNYCVCLRACVRVCVCVCKLTTNVRVHQTVLYTYT